MRSGARHLILYTRPQCHPCAVAAPRVRRAALWAGSALQEIDIDGHPELAVDYGLRIPVVEEAGGPVLAEGEVSAVRLWAAIIGRRWGLTSRR